MKISRSPWAALFDPLRTFRDCERLKDELVFCGRSGDAKQEKALGKKTQRMVGRLLREHNLYALNHACFLTDQFARVFPDDDDKNFERRLAMKWACAREAERQNAPVLAFSIATQLGRDAACCLKSQGEQKTHRVARMRKKAATFLYFNLAQKAEQDNPERAAHMSSAGVAIAASEVRTIKNDLARRNSNPLTLEPLPDAGPRASFLSILLRKSNAPTAFPS